MKDLRVLAGALVAAVAIITPSFAESVQPLPLIVERPNEKVLSVRSGEQYSDAVLVVASQKGLVVIDTGIAPTFTRSYRAKIEETFGRNDFTFVLNTHSHNDHMAGNQVFAAATIVSSEAARAAMIEWSQDLEAPITRSRGRVEGWLRQAEALEPDSPRRMRFSDLATLYTQMADDLESGFEFVPPTITFDSRLTLHLGDMTAHLYCYGPGTHIGNDVIVHIPEVSLVAVGDLFGPQYVQAVQRNEPGVDLDHKLAVLDTVLADEATSQIVINGHGERMSRAELVARRDYLAALTRAARDEAASDGTFTRVEARLPVDEAIAIFSSSGIPEGQLAFEHRASLAAVWMVVRGLEDAATILGRVAREEGADAARREFERIAPLHRKKYFIDEIALNQLGYQLLGDERIDEAVAVFEMNAKTFPESWNVHDSLGEALAARGEVERAIKSYERSLQLNPENTNAVSALERLRAGE